MASIHPEGIVRHPLMRQEWRCAGFVHWQYPAEVVQPLIPEPLELHTHDGRAWVGLTPFTTTLALFGFVRLPGPRRFPETNVRTYVRAPDGSDGVWFLSLDVVNAVNVALGRLGMPYFWADMSVDRDGTTMHYCGRRRSRDEDRAPAYNVHLRYEPRPVERQNELDVFLTGRWRTYTQRGPCLGRFDIEHAPWPLHRAELLDGDHEPMLEAAGLPLPTEPAVVHYSPGVDVSISWPAPVVRPTSSRRRPRRVGAIHAIGNGIVGCAWSRRERPSPFPTSEHHFPIGGP
jgi:uncharacterized protein